MATRLEELEVKLRHHLQSRPTIRVWRLQRLGIRDWSQEAVEEMEEVTVVMITSLRG